MNKDNKGFKEKIGDFGKKSKDFLKKHKEAFITGGVGLTASALMYLKGHIDGGLEMVEKMREASSIKSENV